MVIIHTSSELDKLRESARIVALVHRELKDMIAVGITTMDLEVKTREIIYKERGLPAFIGYRGFPYALCCSLNDVIVHGFPDVRKLQEGDILGIDVGVLKNGCYGDAAFTIGVGKISKEDTALIKATEEALSNAVSVIREGVTTGTIGRIIEQHSLNKGYSVVREYGGHGIGVELHMEPSIPNYGRDIEGIKLKAGMCICVEPLLCIGSAKNHRLDDGWTVVTDDGFNAAHMEHQIIVHKEYGEIISI